MMQASPADVDHDVDDDYEIRRSVESLKSEEATRTRSNSSSTPDEHHNNDDTTAAMDDDNRSASSSSFDDYIPIRSEQISSSEPFVPPLKRDDAPLASILDARLQNINPADLFVDFKQNGILRFSKLFSSGMRSSSKSQIWWSSKTSKKRAAAAAAVIQQATSQPTDEISNNVPTTSATGLYATDDELLLMRPIGSQCSDDNQSNNIVGGSGTCDNSDAQPWRSGPARIWYDQSGIGREFNYGFKLKQGVSFDIHRSGRIISVLQQRHQNDDKLETTMTESSISARPDHQTFLSINLVRWEDNIVYDGEDIRDSLTSGKQPACGWVPTQHTRTYETFISALRNGTFEQMFSKNLAHSSPKLPSFVNTNELDLMRDSGNSLSIFPSDNYELTNTNWEEDIILDADNMDFIPEPKVLTLDFWDDAKIFGMPEDRAQDQIIDNGDSNSPPKQFDRKEHQFTKKSKMILGQVQQRQKLEEEEQLESSLAQMTDKDPFNMSNDEHYLPKNTSRQIQISGAMLIQHSIPAQNIHRMFFPTHLNPFKLRHFHRLPLSKRILRQVGSRFVHMQKLTKHIRQQENLRESQRQAEGGGEIFFMRTIQDISGRDGILMIFEYSEEHPPFLNQPGMASKIRNYYKRKSGKEIEPTFDFGETAFTHTSPFLGNLAPGQALQALENNLYRAPIYRHSMGRNDFLLIRNKQGFFIRTCPLLFCVGQQCPLYEVPSPNSKRATVFVRDFLLAFIYRLFWASDQNPRRLKMEDIKAAFPHYAESSVRKRLKQCSDFKRLGQGTDQNYWVLRQDFRLPSKEEVLAMVTPEMCCAQYSMLAAEQRLKDAGYGEKYFFTPENEDDSDDQVTMEDEIKCAPWCTTRAYISATKGKCLLDQTGIADPTGCGQGFSYVRVSAKPQKEDIPQVPKRLVTGTNADLRKLPLKEAKEICREYGVREEEINSLSRWEIIDVIRTLSTQAAKARADFSGMARFARGNIRFNFADMQDKYKKFCQHIFDLQNQTLENPEPLSTDEGSSGDDSESEELATRVESMLTAAKGKKTVMNDRQKSEYDAEEREREALQRMLRGETNVGDGAKLKADEMAPETTMDARKLKIYRTFVASDGTESVRIEVVSRPQLIEAYVRIRSTRDDAFIKHFAQMDEQYKEERRKEKRRLQDQLRRIRRNEMKAKLHGVPIGGRPVSKPKPHIEKKPLPIKPNLLKMRCSACHGTGHMKTNKNCPLYGNESPASTSTIGKIRPTQSLHSTIEEPMAPTGELIAVEGTKLKISRSFFEHQEKLKRSALRLHIPKQLLRPKTEPVEVTIDTTTTTTRPNDDAVASGSNEDEDDNVSTSTMTTNKNIKSRKPDDADYLHGPQKSVQRRRADPKVTMATHLKAIVNELKLIPNVGHLLHAVNSKKVPDYYKIITNPMDLQQIKMKITENRYELRQQFLADVKQMLDNSRLYNGDNHIITEAARQVFEIASKRIVEKEQKLMKLEKSINPLLDDNDRIGFSYILLGIIQDLKNLPKSVAFHAKVDPKKIPFYYSRISRPMDFGTMESNCKAHHYTTIDAFKRDIEQIRINSEIYNGPPEKSVYTAKAYEIVDCANALIEKNRDQLCELEANMQRAFDEVEDVESMMTGASSVADDFAVDDSRNDDDTGLQQDLAMSGDENDDVNDRIDDEFFDDEEADSSYTMSMTAQLLERSNMQRSGQLNVDLALSDSDDDDGDGTGSRSNAKRSRIDDLNMDVL